MGTYRQNQDKHELFVVDAAITAHNALTGSTFTIESRPDPPDAIIRDGGKRLWVEHTDAFYSSSWARDLSSYAASDKQHHPMPPSMHMSMDERLAAEFCKRVIEKYCEPTYAPLVAQYGPGILVVGLESPWSDHNTIDAINYRWKEVEGSPDLSAVFGWVYLGHRNRGTNEAVLFDQTN